MSYNDLKDGIYIIHENKEWILPYEKIFKTKNIELFEIDLSQKGSIDLDKKPPNGIFWNKMSASSHTRGNIYAKDYARIILNWLDFYNKRIINPLNVLELEINKIAQYIALQKANIKTPKTKIAFEKKDLLKLSENLTNPFIVKNNQGGKGIGVRLFKDYYELYENIDNLDISIDDIYILQEYIKSKDNFITRLEFIAGKFHYAIKVDISDESFKLCPADTCELELKNIKLASAACDIGAKFSLRTDINANFSLVKDLENFLLNNNIEIAGIEFIDTGNELIVYDINTNTNYNKNVENFVKQNQKIPAIDKVVEFLINEFKKIKDKL